MGIKQGIRQTVVALGLLSGAACDTPPADEPTPLEQSEANLLHSARNPLAPAVNAHGFARTASATGAIDLTNPFFQSLGTNGRACVTCHQAGEGWSITPAGVQLRFLLTQGTDPLFRPHDGANAPSMDVSTVEARRNAYSLMLERAVIRVGLPVRPTAEFELAAVDDPYGHASAAQLSLFRRPLPTTNLKFLAAVNWDGRNTPAADPTNIHLGLKNQSNGATVGHAQAPAPIADDVRESIVAFETSITTAQSFTWRAAWLSAVGAEGGPDAILSLPFSIGMNTGPTFDRNVFTVFSSWQGLAGRGLNDDRRDIADGEVIFNTKTFGPFGGTCSGCHNTPNVGSSSSLRFFDVGVSHPARRAPNVPLYTFRHKVTGQTITTMDPGRALISGLWADMNKFKVPGLRGLAPRAPYFHDGSARTLGEVVDHYDRQFNIGYTAEERRKLIRFLEAL